MEEYKTFLASKNIVTRYEGIEVDLSEINQKLFDWQQRLVQWALKKGKAALFEECGLGKTFQQIEWGRLVAKYTGRPVLILAPLAVAHQTIKEGQKLGVRIDYYRSQEEAANSQASLIVANYEMLKAFEPAHFAGVVLDESSILKSYTGTTKRALLEAFKDTRFKLACTATPSPNDHLELGNHAEFLNIMPSNEMIMRWFINDTMQAGNYRLKGHAATDFWNWVTSWAICISTPADIGFSDEGFILPPLNLVEKLVSVDHTRAFATGQLFVDGTFNATSMWREKKATAKDRVKLAVEIIEGDKINPWIVWCDTNDEADQLRKLLPQAVEVRGSETIKEKERKLDAFSDQKARIIITKPDLAGWGLNWQHCPNMVFVGVTYSFEKTYQALRRAYRFGQTRQVNAYLIYAETEGNLLSILRRKQEAFREMQQAMNKAMRKNGALNLDIARELETYRPAVGMILPFWLTDKKENIRERSFANVG